MNVFHSARATASNDHGQGLLQTDAALFVGVGRGLGVRVGRDWVGEGGLMLGEHFLYDEVIIEMSCNIINT